MLGVHALIGVVEGVITVGALGRLGKGGRGAWLCHPG